MSRMRLGEGILRLHLEWDYRCNIPCLFLGETDLTPMSRVRLGEGILHLHLEWDYRCNIPYLFLGGDV
jgi:hypothetical protein